MKTSASKHHLWIPAVAGVTALLGVASANAAFVNVPDDEPEFPGKLLTTGTSGLTGTVVASLERDWTGTLVNANTYQGKLRSMVVDTGAGYDFYYQVINTSLGGANIGNDIFRIAIPGYALTDPLNPVDATYLNDGVTTISGLTGVPALFTSTFTPNGGAVYSADRDPALDTPDFFGGGAAFDFDPSQFVDAAGAPITAPGNIESGENSSWLVLRTNYKAFNVVDSAVQTGGGGTGLATTFAPIPEPSTVLFGLAMIGVCAGSRRRKSRSAQ